jgi:hypothetical protein
MEPKGGDMKGPKIPVQLSREAEREFDEIQKWRHLKVAEWGVKYLRGLIGLPWEGWLPLDRRGEEGIFKSEEHVPFDIRGKVFYTKDRKPEFVLITRFRFRNDFGGYKTPK